MKIVILDNLRSVHNVGSIFRTANAVGVDTIILTGTSPTPLDKKGLRRSDFAKVALGADETIIWKYEEETVKVIERLKKEGFYIIAFEQDEKSIDYKDVDIRGKEKIAFIVGPEVTGITQDILSECDVIVEIPMFGTKESLNVTIAFGIGIYRVLGL